MNSDSISASNGSRALICGITGQDGSYLAQWLLGRGYTVWGTSRDAQASALPNLRALGIADQVQLLSMSPGDFRSVLDAVESSNPHEIYFLAGQSSVGLSFEQPAQTLESVATAVLNLLEVIRLQRRKQPVRFFHAGSSECFGDHGQLAADEQTAFRPCSPYGVAKSAAHWLVCNYRQSYGLFAVNGILYNHESPLRPDRFVTRKIIAAAARIAGGSDEVLRLGRLDIVRDWGWAPDFVQAMWKMLQAQQPQDYVIATGSAWRLEDFVQTAFATLDLDWRRHVQIDPGFFRPSELAWSQGNPARAAAELDWSASLRMPELVRAMLVAQQAQPRLATC